MTDQGRFIRTYSSTDSGPPMRCERVCRRTSTALRRGALLALLASAFAAIAAAPAVAAAPALPSNCSPSATTVTCTFAYTGAEQTFSVPAGVSAVTITAVGAPGGSTIFGAPIAAGGDGAAVQATVPLPPGTGTLYVEVGGTGGESSLSASAVGGFNGGGGGSNSGGGGGGASDVRTCSSETCSDLSTDDTRLVVAGGGGGVGLQSGNGGTAGDSALTGAGNGADAGGCATSGMAPGANGGFGGPAGAGGTGDGDTPTAGGTGALGQGGSAAGDGGGGGGGYFGGGGGGNAGSPNCNGGAGGAGSSFWVSNATDTSMTKGTTGTPSVTITYAPPTSSIATTVDDAATITGWAGTETTGATAYDTATMTTTGAATVPTGTVTYSYYTNGGCTAPAQSTQTVGLNNDGSVPDSSTTAVLDPGSYSYEASYSGDSTYPGSTGACESFTVSKASQTIAFTSSLPSPAVDGGSYTPTATGGASGEPVVFSIASSSGTRVCSLGNSGKTVTFTRAGTCVIDANQAGNADYNAATQQQQTFTVVPNLADVGVSISKPFEASGTAAGKVLLPPLPDGSSFSEKVTVTDGGPASAKDVISELLVPGGLSVTGTDGGTMFGGAVIWTAGSILPGASDTYTVTFKVGPKARGTVAIPVGAASLLTPDPNYANNAAVMAVELGPTGSSA
jgi:hypothetical protein